MTPSAGQTVVCHYCGTPGDLIAWTSASGYSVPACRDSHACTERCRVAAAERSAAAPPLDDHAHSCAYCDHLNATGRASA